MIYNFLSYHQHVKVLKFAATNATFATFYSIVTTGILYIVENQSIKFLRKSSYFSKNICLQICIYRNFLLPL